MKWIYHNWVMKRIDPCKLASISGASLSIERMWYDQNLVEAPFQGSSSKRPTSNRERLVCRDLHLVATISSSVPLKRVFVTAR